MRESAEIQIRRAGPEDAAEIARVLHASFVDYEPLYTRGGFEATTPTTERVLARMAEGPMWVALRDSDVFGTVAAVLKQESLYMRGMAVLPAARGLGVGARLVEQVESWARVERCTRVFLSTTPFLSAAIRLYESAGFRQTDEEPHDLFGTPLFTMEKKMLPQD